MNAKNTSGSGKRTEKDAWDKAKIILTALTPVMLAALGFYVTATLDTRDKSARNTLAEAERSARLNEGIVGQLDDIGAALYAEKENGVYDLAPRIAGITQLAVLAQATDPSPPPYFYTAAIGLLTEYIRQNAPRRRIAPSELGQTASSGPIEGYPGLTADIRGNEPPRFRAVDIVWALRALQEIRIAGEKTTAQQFHIPLTGIDFRYLALSDTPGLDLSGFDFTHSNFDGAFLSGCNCRSAVFHHADLTNVVTWNADFQAADFRRAQLAGSRWENVDFTGSLQSKEDPDFIDAVRYFGADNTGSPAKTSND